MGLLQQDECQRPLWTMHIAAVQRVCGACGPTSPGWHGRRCIDICCGVPCAALSFIMRIYENGLTRHDAFVYVTPSACWGLWCPYSTLGKGSARRGIVTNALLFAFLKCSTLSPLATCTSWSGIAAGVIAPCPSYHSCIFCILIFHDLPMCPLTDGRWGCSPQSCLLAAAPTSCSRRRW
jgi:hypothetical protein